MGTEKTELWDRLGKTDPKHTKGFTRGGGFKGTAIKPMWSYLRMTEEFGPCGTGWGINAPQFDVQECGEERLVFCTVSVWYGTREAVVYGVGGDKVVGKNKYGLATDDEAFKKAFTDATTNALKMIGVGADVHMGMFDDSKYVNTVAREFDEANNGGPPEAPSKSAAALKRTGPDGKDSWQRLIDQLYADFGDCKSLVTLSKLRADYREKARAERWPKQWLEALAGEFDTFEASLPPESADADFLTEARTGSNAYATAKDSPYAPLPTGRA